MALNLVLIGLMKQDFHRVPFALHVFVYAMQHELSPAQMFGWVKVYAR
jgi:hypothetical protein